MIMIYGNPDAPAHPALGPGTATPGFDPLLREIAESGELIDARALADPVTASTLRLHDGVLASMAGPFPAGLEHLVAFVVVDCESRDRAAEIAGWFPNAYTAGVEVRPVMGSSGLEM
ncbi:YciI family protein [Hamadaea sp.]|uniref:YciI family protein n=1 Tax=Hamadaea sp. TaxID=2024425 RepID=UPI0025C1E5B9|nr:YciI family protein [Hamadaea sp.]